MPIDNLPDALILPTRDETRDKALRDYGLRNPDALTVEGTQPYVTASFLADALVPVFGDAGLIAANVSSSNKTGTALVAEAAKYRTGFLPAVGASGFVRIDASAGGGTIFQGDEIKDVQKTQLRFQCLATALYAAGQPVPVIGIDTGPSTNLPAGTVLQWTSPRPGVNPLATVIEQLDGSGLLGGRNQETEQELNDRLTELRSNPPASGNDAELQDAIRKAPGIFAQQGFTYPAINSGGSTGVTFTLRPASPGASRVPNNAQIASMLGYLIGRFQADYSFFMLTILASPVVVALKIAWARGAIGWADAVQWPPFATPMVTVTAAMSPTSFTVGTGASIAQPSAGQTIAVYDAANGVFRKKRILSFTGAGPWVITADTTNAASDTTFTPVVGEPVCPWSESLQGVVPNVLQYFDKLGPGEQLAGLPDPGLRQRRSPVSPQFWPSTISNRLVSPLFALPTVQDVSLLAPSIPFTPSVGTPRVSVNLLTLGGLAVYP